MPPNTLREERRRRTQDFGLTQRQSFAEQLAVEAADLANNYFLEAANLTIETKNPRDFVSARDRAVEDMIRAHIRATWPDDHIVGEEMGGAQIGSFWCTDPIDGTSNFLSGIPLSGVSIGYCGDGVSVAGAICIPMLDILLSANSDTPGIRHNGVQVAEQPDLPIPTMVMAQSAYWDQESYVAAQRSFT